MDRFVLKYEKIDNTNNYFRFKLYNKHKNGIEITRIKYMYCEKLFKLFICKISIIVI